MDFEDANYHNFTLIQQTYNITSTDPVFQDLQVSLKTTPVFSSTQHIQPEHVLST